VPPWLWRSSGVLASAIQGKCEGRKSRLTQRAGRRHLRRIEFAILRGGMDGASEASNM